jgi:hypothetical protein
MATMTSLERTLAREREALLGTIAWLSEAALDQEGVIGARSIKDVLAHLAVHERAVVCALRQLLTAGASSWSERTSVEECTSVDLHIARREALSPTEQVLELERVRSDLLHLLAGLDDKTLTGRGPWGEEHGTLAEYILTAVCGHECEHHAAIRHAIHRIGVVEEYGPGARLSRGLAPTHA